MGSRSGGRVVRPAILSPGGFSLLEDVAGVGLIAVWYVAPRLRQRAHALTALLWVNVFRYVVLYLFQAQREGYGVTDQAVMQLVVGDVAGAALAIIGLVLLRLRSRAGVLLAAESVADFVAGIRQRAIDPPHGPPFGGWWLVFTFFAPLILVSVPLLVWQLMVAAE